MFFAAVYPFPTNKIAHWYQKIHVFSYSLEKIKSYLQVIDGINQPTGSYPDPMDTSGSGIMKK
jgi:hypothetical protein